MSVLLPEGETPESLARFGVSHLRAIGTLEELKDHLVRQGLSMQDAERVADRITGGMTRALFPNANAPDAARDPIARAAWDIARDG